MAKVTTLLNIEQGVDFSQGWVWSTQDAGTAIVTPKDLTGWTAYCQIRSGPAPSGYLLQDNVSVTLGGTQGTITLTVPAEMSWTWQWDMGMYDIILFDPDGRPQTRFATGRVVVEGGATQKP